MNNRVLALLLFVAALSACGTQSASLPATNSLVPNTAQVSFHIVLPQNTADAKHPTYISPSSTYVQISDTTVSGPIISNDFSCSSTACNGTIAAPLGPSTFTIALYDVQRRMLSQGQTTTTIVAGQANVVAVTFNPVVASISGPAVNAPHGAAATINFAFVAKDVDGNVIVGPGTYMDANLHPITITASISDPRGATTLTKATSTGANDPMTLQYDGTRFDKAIISATATTLTAPIPNGSFVAIGNPTTFSYPGNGPPSMTEGPDGALWIAATANSGFSLIRVSSTGTQTTYTFPSSALLPVAEQPSGIVTGPDGNLWVALGLNSAVERVSTAGVGTSIPVASGQMSNLSVGPDNNLWGGMGIGSGVAQITPSGTVTEYTTAGSFGAPPNWPRSSAFGTDGKLYYVNNSDGAIDIFDIAAHTYTEHKLNNNVLAEQVSKGSDGNIWFTGFVNNGSSYVGYFTNGLTTQVEYQFANGILNTAPVNGADGAIWFADQSGGLHWRDTSGAFGTYQVPVSQGGGIAAIAITADGSFWIATYDAQGKTYLINSSY